MGESANYREGAPSGVLPDEEQNPPLLSRQDTTLLDGADPARRTRPGLTTASAGLLHEDRHADPGDDPLRGRILPIGTRRTYGPAWSRPAVRSTAPPRDDSEGAPSYVDSLSPWDRESFFYTGRLRGVEAVNFRHGVYMGAYRLWQDYRRPGSLARRLLDDGVGAGMDGFVRWTKYNRDRRLLWCTPAPMDAPSVSTLPVHSGTEGSCSSGSSSSSRDSNVQFPA